MFVREREPVWARLEHLTRRASRPRRLAPGEADELVALYQQTATDLSVVSTRAPDGALVARLSLLVVGARAALSGGGEARPPGEVLRTLLLVDAPAMVWRSRWWVLGVATAFFGVATAMGVWTATDGSAAARALPPADVQALCATEFEDYYSSQPAGDFAFQVWVNNARIAVLCLVAGVLVLPVLGILALNAIGVGQVAGYLHGCGEAATFWGLITPHGLPELGAVLLAAAVGLRTGWTLLVPGRRRRLDAVAAEGRAALPVAAAMVVLLLYSGVVEAFVTPSPLPTPVRVGIGVLSLAGLVGWVVVLGRQAYEGGATGDATRDVAGEQVLTA